MRVHDIYFRGNVTLQMTKNEIICSLKNVDDTNETFSGGFFTIIQFLYKGGFFTIIQFLYKVWSCSNRRYIGLVTFCRYIIGWTNSGLPGNVMGTVNGALSDIGVMADDKFGNFIVCL